MANKTYSCLGMYYVLEMSLEPKFLFSGVNLQFLGSIYILSLCYMVLKLKSSGIV